MTRVNIQKSLPMAMAAMLGMESYVRTHVDRTVGELVKLRASALNGCVYCLTMHSRDAAKHGESQERIAAAKAWPGHREHFTETELVALELTDAVTHVNGEESVPDELWDQVVAHFGHKGAGQVLMAIVTINAWNRIGISTRLDPASL